MAKKYYAVKVGLVPGIYETWDECKKNVDGFPGAKYKSFSSKEEAAAFCGINKRESTILLKTSNSTNFHIKVKTDEQLKEDAYILLSSLHEQKLLSETTCENIKKEIERNIKIKEFQKDQIKKDDHLIIYVDGSYNKNTNEYGCGAYLENKDQKRIISKRGLCQEGGRNVEGEVAAVVEALRYFAVVPYLKTATVYYDYEGIGSWADKRWKTNKCYTIAYSRFVDQIRKDGKSIIFEHVKGHSGDIGNELVDKIAKVSCGNEITQEEALFLDNYSEIPGFPKSIPELSVPQKYTLMGDYMPDFS